ncbi:hypothetical protein P6U16_27525 (plasmid) [Rhizobium sp. 32-5/1]|uniref:hypothetical protein n=1 Tax=Rhizobium sp. 32-5/1 TaxID=3019602 RepID=UPI00240DCE0B|nr:hypothetical protein [Rhizobium sp. 32-5/1]WEZ86300.1 hypothetical protein P6U16_27525 [Rhizobium sp. 32-5/1]
MITKAALQLGVPVGASVRALIDAGSVTFSGVRSRCTTRTVYRFARSVSVRPGS